MRFSLRAKVILTVSLFLVVIFTLMMYLSLTRDVNQLNSGLNEQSKSFAALATPPIGNTFLLYQDSGSVKIDQQINKFLALDPDVTAIGIVSIDGKQVFGSQGLTNLHVKPALASSFSPQYLRNSSGYIREVVQPLFEDSGAHRYSVVYEISTQRIEKTVMNTVRQIIIVDIAILLASITAASLALNTLFIKPLREVSHSADIVSAGDYNQQIVTHADSQDEIGKLAQAVNRMADSLKADIGKLREVDKLKSEFLMIASHNLRTPLTIMRSAIDNANYVKDLEGLKNIIKTIQEGVVRLHLLSEDLLTISSLESGGEKMEKTPIGARKFIDSVAGEFKVLAEKKQLDWRFTNSLPDDLQLNISQANMRSALGNMIDNAIKFTKDGGSVHVAARVAKDRLVFSVTDTGIGIRQEEVPRLFTKFHRGTSTLTYDYEGAGIGLYLTKLIVGEHGGQINVQSQIGHGSTFSVYLPLSPGSASAPPAPAARPPAA